MGNFKGFQCIPAFADDMSTPGEHTYTVRYLGTQSVAVGSGPVPLSVKSSKLAT